MSVSGEQDLADLRPMRVRCDSVQSTIADYLARDLSEWEAASAQTMGPSETHTIMNVPSSYFTSPVGTRFDSDARFDYNEPLERFARNEIAYDEFMQMTGGMDLDEEAAGYDSDEGVEEPSNAKRRRLDCTSSGVIDEVLVNEEDAGPSTVDEDLDYALPAGEPLDFTMPLNEKLLEEVDDDRLLGIPLELRNSDALNREQTAKKAVLPERRVKTDKTLDALIGQANVIYAKGQVKESLMMLLEVIRQDPRMADAYRQVADIYNDLNRPQKSLEYGLLAAHLNGTRTTAVEWADLGEYAIKLKRFREAAACFGKAITADPTNPVYYEKRIETLEDAGLHILTMKTRFAAAQNVDRSRVPFEWFRKMITIAADHYIHANDEAKAVSALEIHVLRSYQFGIDATEEHKVVIKSLVNSNRFADAAKSIFALCPSITAVDENEKFIFEINYNNASYTVKSFPPEKVHRFIVGDSFPTAFLAYLVICFIRIGRKDLVPTLIDKLLERPVMPQDEGLFLEIAKAYYTVDCIPHAHKYMEHLISRDYFSRCAEAWYLYGLYLSMRKKTDEACDAYKRALDIQPSHVDARINYSTIQQRMGLLEEAFETLRDYVLDAGSSLPDERLLLRQADFLCARKRKDEFARCVRMLLAPHFYEIYKNGEIFLKRRTSYAEKFTHLSCNGIRLQAFNAVRGSPFEKFVKRVGQLATAEERPASEMTGIQLHDYSFKLLETLFEQKRYSDALHTCCYAFLQPLIAKNMKTLETFQCALMFCAMKAQVWGLAFEYLRWYHTASVNNHPLLMPANHEVLFTRIFNSMNYVFCHFQNVSYHRYVMRALTRSPGNRALQMISGNNSLITGAYRHALGEYLRVWKVDPNDSLACMLIGLTFIHMSCKKDIYSRHVVALRGLAFMSQYQGLRKECQETFYNIGRMFHQMNLLSMAEHFYEKCLNTEIPRTVVTDESTGEEKIEQREEFDLRPYAAHNLALIYQGSGNVQLARLLLEKYCIF